MKSNRVLLKISGSKEQINLVLKQIVNAFGESNVVYNYPVLDQRTGFYSIFMNILRIPSCLSSPSSNDKEEETTGCRR